MKRNALDFSVLRIMLNLSRGHSSALLRLLSLVSMNTYSPSIICFLPSSSVISRKEADFSIMGKGFRTVPLG